MSTNKSKMLRIDDKISNLRDRFKKSDNPKLRRLSKKDIHELLKIEAELMADLMEAAPKYKYDTISLGFGLIKIYYKAPSKYKCLKTGKMKMAEATPVYYFRPSPDTKRRVKEAYRKKLKEDEERE